MASHPLISFHTDERLRLGEFGIQARLVRPEAPEQAPPREPAEQERGHTMIYSTSARVGAPVQAARGTPRHPRALLLVGGRRVLVPPSGGVIGRSRDCDIVLEDAGVSRRHAEIRPSGQGWAVQDLGSTNGVLVNGRALHGIAELTAGDSIEIGSTQMLFEVS